MQNATKRREDANSVEFLISSVTELKLVAQRYLDAVGRAPTHTHTRSVRFSLRVATAPTLSRGIAQGPAI